jgi:peptidoglycan-associated lipoprotein
MRLGMVTMLGSLALSVCVGCGGDDKKPAETGGASAKPTTSTASIGPSKKEDDDGSKAQLNISDEIKKACGITNTDAFFAYDSANVLPEAQQLLGKLATCFSTGPLAKRQMRLVGHADPRGDEDYNMVLGGKRADSLKVALVKAGLAGGQVDTTSRGEMDASGSDEAGWARDRRVDIALGN